MAKKDKKKGGFFGRLILMSLLAGLWWLFNHEEQSEQPERLTIDEARPPAGAGGTEAIDPSI